MLTSPDNMTSLISLMQSRGRTDRVAQPEHPALQAFVSEIQDTLHAKGPLAAAEHCGEALIAISGLLELVAHRDTETMVILASSNLTEWHLTQFGLWLDQYSHDLTKTLS